MKKLSTIIVLVLVWVSGLSQSESLKRVDIKKEIVNVGAYKHYFKYDLGEMIVYNGIRENNLKIQIINKINSKIVYSKFDTLSDAMILKPTFFESSQKKKLIIIMLEVAAEYSWGQEIILIKDGKVFHPGYLNYAINKENGTSIANYSHFTKIDNIVLLTFDDVPIVNWDNEKKVIPGSSLKFEITEKQINKK